MAFEARKFNTFLSPPKGYQLTDLLLVSYSLSPDALDEVMAQSQITRTYHQRLEELAKHVVCLCQNDRWTKDISYQWKEYPFTHLLFCKGRVVGIPPSKGSFHPKLIAMLYQKEGQSDQKRLRMVISSRNLTTESYLEGACCLETDQFAGKPINLAFHCLSDLTGSSNINWHLLTADFSNCVKTSLGLGPDAGYSFDTAGPSFRDTVQRLANNASEFVAVSPFLGNASFLEQFMPVNGQAWIITNDGVSPDLAAWNEIHKRIYFPAQSKSEFPDEASAQNQNANSVTLHAKVYAMTCPTEKGPEYHLFLGSANFSEHGFSRNTELMLHLTSRQVDFCTGLLDSLGDLQLCTGAESYEIERPAGLPLPVLDDDAHTVQELLTAVEESWKEAALQTFFYQVFQKPFQNKAPVDYALDILGSYSEQVEPNLRSVWKKNLDELDPTYLPESLRHYDTELRRILSLEGQV